MGADCPKQYLRLAGRPLIEITLERLLAYPGFNQVWLALNPDDRWWQGTRLAMMTGSGSMPVAVSGPTPCAWGLQAIADQAQEEDWVLVHDVARPCLRHSDLKLLVEELQGDPVGGLLGVPVYDTVKRVDADHCGSPPPSSGAGSGGPIPRRCSALGCCVMP